jgi:hypothetical protein
MEWITHGSGSNPKINMKFRALYDNKVFLDDFSPFSKIFCRGNCEIPKPQYSSRMQNLVLKFHPHLGNGYLPSLVSSSHQSVSVLSKCLLAKCLRSNCRYLLRLSCLAVWQIFLGAFFVGELWMGKEWGQITHNAGQGGKLSNQNGGRQF